MALTKFQLADLIGGIMCLVAGVGMLVGGVRRPEQKSLRWWGLALIVVSSWIVYSVWWEM
jgi:hypothetical protein